MTYKRVMFMCLLVVFCFMGNPVSAALEQGQNDKIDNYINAELKTHHIPGLSIGIVENGETVFLKGYGTAGDNGRLVEITTPFVIGSVTKTFTALAIRQLAGEGHLDLNATIDAYIPWFNITDDQGTKIKVSQLVAQTSGFSTASGVQAYTYNAKYSLKEMVERINETEHLNRRVGERYEYSNLNYIILGYLIEVISGQPYQDYLANAVFQPLEMVHTGFYPEREALAGLAQGYRSVYGFNLPTHFDYPQGLMASGFIHSSAEDMTHLLRAFLNNGYYGGKTILPNNPLQPFDAAGGKYYDELWAQTSGAMSGNYNGFYGIVGATPNYNSAFFMNQQERLGIVVLINQGTDHYKVPGVTAQTIANSITDILLGKDSPPPLVQKTQAWLWLIPLSSAALVITMVLGVYRRARKLKYQSQMGNSRLHAIKDIIRAALSIFILIGCPLFFDNTWKFFLASNPEYVFPVFVVIVANLIAVIANYGLRLFRRL